MSKYAKVSLLVAFLSLVAAVVLQVMTGYWLNLNSALVALSGALVVLAVIIDHKMYWEFLTMRTTKHGMNMGAMILLVITLLVCVNYLANRHNKTWDVTQEKLNSLSDQTTSLLKNLNEDMDVRVFFKGAAGQEDRQKIKQNLQAYQEYSPRVKLHLYNLYVESELAMRYLSDLPDREASPIFVFVEYKGRRVRAEQPFDEAAFTSAMVKATRQGESKIYFVRGHGEKDLEAENDQGLREFKTALEEASFKVDAVNLIDKKAVPADAQVLAIIGPQTAYLEDEINWIRDYLKTGGRVFVAIDPGQRHGLANLTKTLGVQFENNYVLTRTPLVGWGPVGVLGLAFDPTSEITRSFPTGASFALFPLASEVKRAQGAAEALQTKELVKTDASTFTMTDPNQALTQAPPTRAVTLGMSAAGSLPEGKPFEAAIFGDSDFLSNRALTAGVNRDLALNVIAQLTSQKDLISIRPKLPQGSMIVLTGTQQFLIVILGLALPVILLITSGVLWFRRRGA